MDWNTNSPYQELNRQASSLYEQFLPLILALLERLRRGEIEMDAVQNELQQFGRDKWPEFSRQLTVLGFEMSRAMADLQSKTTDDFMRGLLGDLPEPDAAPPPAHGKPSPPPIDGDEAAWATWVNSCSAYLLDQNQQGMNRYRILLDKVSRGDLSPAMVQEYTAKYLQQQGLGHAHDAAGLNGRFMQGLLELNRRFGQELFQRLASRKSEPHATGEENTGPSVHVDLIAPIGSAASASLTVTNPTEETSEVTCLPSDFQPDDGSGDPFPARLEVIPDRFRLAPGQTLPIQLRLHLDPEQFRPGKKYAATLRIRQHSRTTLAHLLARSTAP